MNTRFINWTTWTALSLTFVWTSGCVIQAGAPLHKETRTLTVPHLAARGVDVETANGAISVTGADRSDVQIVATIRALSEERLKQTEIVAERTADKTLRLRAKWPGGKRKNREGCSFAVQLPDAKGIHLRSSNGKLHTEGLAGTADLTTSNGQIEVIEHGGPVKSRTSNGAIRVRNADGTVDLRTSNGKIEVVAARQRVAAHTSNGALSILLADDGTGPIQASTSNGSVTLEIGSRFAGELDLQTSHGSLNVGELPDSQLLSSSKNRIKVNLGDSANQSRITTSNGSITVRSRSQ